MPHKSRREGYEDISMDGLYRSVKPGGENPSNRFKYEWATQGSWLDGRDHKRLQHDLHQGCCDPTNWMLRNPTLSRHILEKL